MFTTKELRLLEQSYFETIRSTDDFYEIKSKNTKHCWIISKSIFDSKLYVQIYHKHTIKTAYYHKHAKALNVEHTIKLIKNHDHYVLHPEMYNAARVEHKTQLA